MKLFKTLLVVCLPFALFSQSLNHVQKNQLKMATDKGKAVNYNALGIGVFPSSELMAGGNHVNYRRYGFGISWRVGVQAILDIRKMNISNISIDNAGKNSWLTGNHINQYAYSINFNYVKALTKKIPFYMGAGLTRIRTLSEVNAYGNPLIKEWIMNEKETGFALNFGAGVFLPITSRLILNVGYDYQPQTMFIGICIASPYNWEDIDLW
jgi:opacity protein-like surface antigen